MGTISAAHYREKARELHGAAASASDDEARNQFTDLARQYEQLADSAETLNDPSQPSVRV
jgi:hypothetical protein